LRFSNYDIGINEHFSRPVVIFLSIEEFFKYKIHNVKNSGLKILHLNVEYYVIVSYYDAKSKVFLEWHFDYMTIIQDYLIKLFKYMFKIKYNIAYRYIVYRLEKIMYVLHPMQF
jgi:hypothetical protein